MQFPLHIFPPLTSVPRQTSKALFSSRKTQQKILIKSYALVQQATPTCALDIKPNAESKTQFVQRNKPLGREGGEGEARYKTLPNNLHQMTADDLTWIPRVEKISADKE